jgi:hypothetical protein
LRSLTRTLRHGNTRSCRPPFLPGKRRCNSTISPASPVGSQRYNLLPFC